MSFFRIDFALAPTAASFGAVRKVAALLKSS
jgi:hypothetical protein